MNRNKAKNKIIEKLKAESHKELAILKRRLRDIKRKVTPLVGKKVLRL